MPPHYAQQKDYLSIIYLFSANYYSTIILGME